MRKIQTFLLLCAFATGAFAQEPVPSSHGSGPPPGSQCSQATNYADRHYDDISTLTPTAYVCGSGGWVLAAPGSGGSGSPAPYTMCASGCSTTIPASPFAVTVATHGQGKYPYVFAYNNSNNPVAINWTIDTSGNLTAITYTGTLNLVVIASGSGTTGPTGATGAAGSTGATGPINRIYNSGSALAVEPFVNFVNGGCVDNSGATRTDCTFAVQVSLPPYLQIGSGLYITDDHMYQATLPSSAGTPFPGWTSTSTSTGTSVAITNGNATYSNNATAVYLGEPSHIVSIEAVFAISTGVNTGTAIAGIYVCDATNSKIYVVNRALLGTSATPQIQFQNLTFSGTCAAMGNPGSTSTPYAEVLMGAVSHIKLAVSGTTLTAYLSNDGGASFTILGTATVGTIGKVGIWVYNGNANFLSIAVT